ncbi:MAG: PAS domain S-box protein, partial [Rariglobus sp.]
MPAESAPVFCNPFAAGDFFPRWLCGAWTDFHGWTHILADVAIFGAYAAIPALILYFVLKRKDVQLPTLWWLFAAFIFSCGFGHLIEAVIFWHPWDRFSAVVKVVTAVVSWGTVIALARHMPALLNLPGMHQLNLKLREEIAARAKTEAEKERFFNLSLDMLCIADMSGRFTKTSPAFFDVLGYTEAEMTSRPFVDLIHPDDREATAREMEKLRAGQSTIVLENRYKAKDGSWRLLAWKAAPSTADGLIYAIARDITASRAAEAAEAERIRKSLHLQQTLLQLRDDIGDDLGEFYRKAVQACATALSVDSVTLWQFDADRSHILCVEQQAAGGGRPAVGTRLASADYPAYFEAIMREDSVVVADNAREHPDTCEFFRDAVGFGDVSSMLDAPVRGGDQLAGLLCCEHTGPLRHWTDDEIRFVTSLASYVMLALQQDGRKRTESALRETEELSRRIIQSFEDHLRVLDLNGRVLSIAGPGRDGGLVESSMETNWLSFWHDQSREAARNALATAAQGRSVRFQAEENSPAGKSCAWWDVIVSPINGDDGRPARLVVVSRDITQQRRNEEEIRRLNTNLEQLVVARTAEVAAGEERFRLMVDQVQDYAIYMLDCDGLVASWNEGAQRAKGYHADEILGHHFSCFYDESDQAAGKPASILARAREHGRVLDEGWRVRKDGTRFWAEVVITAIHDEKGQLRGFAKVTHDLTERKKIEAQSLRSQRLESIGTLAGGIAHDLNNALAPILMAIGVLRSDHPGSADILDLIQNSASRGADMVRHLLAFAKGVEGRRAPVSPSRLVHEVVTIMRSTFPKNIQVVTRFDEDLPEIVGDSTQLHQVLVNLCVNSRDAMPDGGLLTIEAGIVDVDNTFLGTLDAGEARLGRHVRFRIIDTGTGIPPGIVDRIFDPFFTTKPPDKGSGLGLSNALGIIKGHGGFFHVYSQLGRGTTISMYLPSTYTAESVEEPPVEDGEFRGQGEHILFVDDEGPVRAVARRVLSALNYHPLTANDGTDGLIQVAQSGDSIKAVITDLHMPHMDGEAFARALHR